MKKIAALNFRMVVSFVKEKEFHSLRRKTYKSQNPPSDLQESIEDFHAKAIHYENEKEELMLYVIYPIWTKHSCPLFWRITLHTM